MINRLVNKLLGRAGPPTDAVSAFVDGNASADEVKLVEQMMRDDPALKKVLATQKAMLEVLGRLGKVQAHRSFAITPEMVAAAEASDSRLSRLAELFAPQRKLALAPVILAGFAALTVALLTLGDITAVVEQSGERESFSTAAVAESAAPADRDATTSMSLAADTAAEVPEIAGAVEKSAATGTDGDMAALSEPQAPDLAIMADTASTADMPSAAAAVAAAPAPEAIGATAATAPAVMESLEALASADDAGTEAPLSLAAPAPDSLPSPAPETADVTVDSPVVDDVPKRAAPDLAGTADIAGLATVLPADADSGAIAGAGEGADTGAFAGAAQGAFEGIAEGATEGSLEGAVEGIAEGAGTGALKDAGAGNGISLPLWQLQIVLAALAVVAIGAWAGLRRIRRY